MLSAPSLPCRSLCRLPCRWALALGGLWLGLAAAPLSAAWSWSTRRDGGDLWLTAAQDGAPLFDLRLGAGGAIAEVDYLPAAGADLLANPYGDNDTDRVIQWTLWSDSYAVTTPAGSEPFNEDLAGSGDGTFSPIVAVNVGPGVIDVYAVPQDQWDRSLNGAMLARYAALTRYELLPNGVLKVRRVIRTADIAGPADGGHAYDVYFEQWNPFRVGAGAFNAYALSLDSSGQPDWWYQANQNIPYYQYLPAVDSFGYAVIYQTSAWLSQPVIGVVYGTKELSVAADPELSGAGGRSVFNSMGWGAETPADQGIALLPALQLTDVPARSVIDISYYLVLRPHADAALKSDLAQWAAAAPAPALYGAGHAFTGDLAEIVPQLDAALGAAGVRTEHLATLLRAAAVRPAAP